MGTDVTFRTLEVGELDAWARLCASIFPDPAAYFLRHYENDPFADPKGVFVAEDAGELVASTRVFSREIYLRGRRVGLGGIGEVCTRPEYRGRGLSGRLLQMAIRYMAEKSLPLSLLFTDQYAHYARHGWFQVPRRFKRVALRGARLQDGWALRPLEAADWPAARGLHGLFSGRLDGLIVRDHPLYWDRWVSCEVQRPMALIDPQGEMRLWLDAAREGDTVLLWEVSAAPGYERLILPAMAAFAPVQWASLPAALAPDGPGEEIAADGVMLRLNAPFHLDGDWIDTPEKLRALLPGVTVWRTDGF